MSIDRTVTRPRHRYEPYRKQPGPVYDRTSLMAAVVPGAKSEGTPGQAQKLSSSRVVISGMSIQYWVRFIIARY
jgi:hypothetical protein